MSDPFNIISGAAGIISVGLTIAQGLLQIADGVGSAGQEVRSYAEEINVFSKLLKQVKAEFERSPNISIEVQSLINDVVGICDRLLQPLDILQKTLRPLVDRFKTSPKKFHQLGLRVQWVFRTKNKVLFYCNCLKEEHRVLNTIIDLMILQTTRDHRPQETYNACSALQNSLALMDQSYRETRQLDVKTYFEEESPDALATPPVLQLIKEILCTPIEKGVEVENPNEELCEEGIDPMSPLLAINEISEELINPEIITVNKKIEYDLNSESLESAQEIWGDIRALERKVSRIATRVLEPNNTHERFTGNSQERNSDNSDKKSNTTPEKFTNGPDISDYSIGWICSDSTQCTAARAFLDVIHTSVASADGDGNIYTLGKVGEHNVVIAQLQEHMVGLSASASVAANLLRSFHNIRLCLLLSVGGGVGSVRHDIRLGDVVVGFLRGGVGGVLQFDPAFLSGSAMYQPPMILMSAVQSLEVQYDLEGNRLVESISNTIKKYPKLKARFRRPTPKSDRLYRAHNVHPQGAAGGCAEVCDPIGLAPRADRAPYGDVVRVHLGLIASSNKAMDDALTRDHIAEKNDVLCFESGAARIEGHFPLLVICEIGNYADSHKSDEWAGFGAMASAAYAKELLSLLPS